MTTEKLTIHRALSELKIIDSRINKAIGEGVFVTANKHSNAKINGMTIGELQSFMKSSLESITSIITRKNAIKRAVDLSNATTKVTINGVEMTVVEAINLKNHGLESKLALVNAMKKQYTLAINKATSDNNTLNERAESYVIGMYGGKDTKTDPSTITKAKQEFIEMNTIDIVDGVDILKTIKALEEEIFNFTAEVDATLSESNAITQITIEY